jgi:Uma2 family endonuclease
MATLPTSPLTEEQYLAIEREAEFKSEFHDGQMFAMAGGSPNHARLSSNINAILHRQMPAGCHTFTSDLRIKVGSGRLYTYPDCSVVCGELELFSDQRDVLLNPILIVEVLSPSTEGYDRGKKFELYRTIASFRDQRVVDTLEMYLIIHQDRRYVEHHSKQDDGSWLLREHSGPDGSVAIARLGVSILLAELYASATDLG